ncbi:MAG TPA: hypothetical protein PKW45_20540, partial [Bryobacteraceae bacterium]|nr:hypothetical protein [Bryobacteraceae bacterium]
MTALVLLLLLSIPLGASPPQQRQHVLRVPVWIDPGDADAAAATAKDFSAKVDGAAAPVLAARGPDDGLVILLVLDWTDDFALADSAREALIAEIGKLPDNARVALLRSQDGLQVLLDPTGDRATL